MYQNKTLTGPQVHEKEINITNHLGSHRKVFTPKLIGCEDSLRTRWWTSCSEEDHMEQVFLLQGSSACGVYPLTVSLVTEIG